MSNRTLIVHLSSLTYLLLCLILSVWALRSFNNKLDQSTGPLSLSGLLIGHIVPLIAASFILAALFALFSRHHSFALVRFVSIAIFFVLPAMLIALAIRSSSHSTEAPRFAAALSVPMLAIAGLLIGTYIYARFIEPYRPQMSFYKVSSKKLAGLKQPLRIVVLADIQADHLSDYEQSVFNKTLQLKPDLILFAGDYLECPDRLAYQVQAKKLSRMLSDMNFQAPSGSFAVTGNAEAYFGATCFDRTSVQWLPDRSVIIERDGVSINLTGLSIWNSDDLSGHRQVVLAHLDSSQFNIVLAHMPNFVMDLKQQHYVDLCLCGHTHGGQIRLPYIGALATACRIPRSQASGHHRINGTDLIMSRGIGVERNWAPRLRFLCPPEIVVVDLMPLEQNSAVQNAGQDALTVKYQSLTFSKKVLAG